MLRITVDQEPDAATLRLEGRVVGPWVSEFEQAWHSLDASLGSRKLRVDLRGVTHMNADARRILAEIYQQTGAEFLADMPMIKYFTEEAQRGSGKDTKWEA